MGDLGDQIHHEHPFQTPADQREPARRLRGRLTSPVTIWTAYGAEGPVGLTVSSIIVAEGTTLRFDGPDQPHRPICGMR